MLSWSRYYNGLEYTFRMCQGKDCEMYTWLHGDRCALCEMYDVPKVEGNGNKEEAVLSTMMDDCCLDN